MADRGVVPQLGIRVYGAAAIALGLVGFAWRDFATNWQHVPSAVPHRVSLALLAAACELLGGGALFWQKTERVGAALLTLTFAVFTALWIPDILHAPGVYDGWGNFFEELSIFLGGLCAFAVLAPHDSAWNRTAPLISRIYGVCPISFGLVHIISFSGAVSYVPAWIPPGQRFWVAATAAFFLLAAVAILTGILAALAARLLTAMIFGFELLIWAPHLAAAPHQHFNWSGNVIGTAIGAATWVVADVLAASRRPAPAIEEATIA